MKRHGYPQLLLSILFIVDSYYAGFMNTSCSVQASAALADSYDATEQSVSRLLEDTRLMQSQLASHAEALTLIPTSLSELETLARNLQLLTHHVDRAKVALASRMEADIAALHAGKISTSRSRFRSVEERLSQVMHISPAEVRRWLTVARAITPVENVDGEVAIAHPFVRDAFQSGAVGVDAAARIITSLGNLQAPIKQISENDDEAAVMTDRIESGLIKTAETGTPAAVGRAIKVWEARIDSMGVLPSEEVRQAYQGAFYQGKKFGFHQWLMRVDDLQHEVFLTAIAPEVNPRTKNHELSDAAVGDEPLESAATARDESGKAVEPPKDKRSLGQKRLDGAIHALTVGLQTGKFSIHGGYQPQVMVNIDHESLERDLKASDRLFRSDAVHSGPINPRIIRQLACNADLLPVVLGSGSQVVDAGNRARLFSAEQRKILYARDRGCTFPGCQTGMDKCQAHHVHEYSRGGVTTLENAALVCSFHHHVVHETEWTIDMRSGVPFWKPPLAVDPNQQLLRNVFFHPEKPEQLALTV